MAKALPPAVPHLVDVEPDDAEALTPELQRELVRLARGLHESGALAFLVALAEGSGTVTREMAEWTRLPGNRKMLQNLVAIYSLLQQIDTEVLLTVAHALEDGLVEAGRARRSGRVARAPTLTTLWREASEPDVRRGLLIVFGFLRGVGRAQSLDPPKPNRPR
ncbi:MAG: DUF1641 domain-containing protein [Thermoplasmata archaeon]